MVDPAHPPGTASLMPDSRLPTSLADALTEIVGPRGILTAPADIAPFCEDWRGLYHGQAAAVVRPASTEECAAVVRLCGERRVGIVPQGGNTSMVGGATPDETGAQIVLTLARMTQLRAIDPVDMTMIAEAGMPWQRAQDAAAEAGCLLPLSIGSEGTAQVGGILSTNAGGNNTVRYGNARELVLGLEAVLPDGQIWHGLRALRKDNTGYALRQLLLGAEGTLGIITAAVLRLVPQPRATEVAFCAVPSAEAALQLFTRIQRGDPASLSAFEYMSGEGIGFVLRHIPDAKLPIATRAEHYVLIEVATAREGTALRDAFEADLTEAIEAGEVEDATLAASSAQRAAMWRLREEHSEAQKREGASVKNDVSVPVSSVPTLIREASEAGRQLIPGIRPVPFGHMGDGNIHMNFEQPPEMPAADFLARAGELMDAVSAVVRRLGGSFSAEHGVGRLKPYMMPGWRGGAELDAMRRIKQALDPIGIMNPGKVLPEA